MVRWVSRSTNRCRSSPAFPLAAALVVSGLATAQTVPDLESITATWTERSLENEPAGYRRFVPAIEVRGSNLAGVTVLFPDGGFFGFSGAGGVFQLFGNSEDYAQPVLGDYVFQAWSPDGGVAMATVTIQPTPTTGFARVIWPSSGATAARQPTIALLPSRSAQGVPFGARVELEVSDGSQAVAGPLSVSVDDTWIDVTNELSPQTSFQLSATVWAGPSSSLQTTLAGDDFLLVQESGHSNEVSFWTALEEADSEVVVPVQLRESAPWRSIGALEVRTRAPSAVPKVSAEFYLDPAWSGLKSIYDFRWVSVLVGASGPGAYCPPASQLITGQYCCPVNEPFPCGEDLESVACLGYLSAIDPPPAPDPPACVTMSCCTQASCLLDSQPFYYPWWFAGTCPPRPGLTAFFTDSPGSFFDPPYAAYSTFRFETFLVATSTQDPRLMGNRFLVLAGFEWLVDHYADQASVLGVLNPKDQMALAEALDEVADALANSQTNPYAASGDPHFAEWQVLEPSAANALLVAPPQILLGGATQR